MKPARAAAVRAATTLQTQRVLLRHVDRSFLHRALLAWREPAWRSRRAIQKMLVRVLYLASQRFRRTRLLRAAFHAWPTPAGPRRLVCPACSLTEPPGLERGRWQ